MMPMSLSRMRDEGVPRGPRAYAKEKVTEWDVLKEPYTNKDLQAVLGDAEMTSWFRHRPPATAVTQDRH
jgi:hypothetical protein